ncbi:MAG: hypothetical protein KBT19_00660 [Lachnospiraceae bacterium]|nr:hypothetical protein [Candidatus Colinaster equi]
MFIFKMKDSHRESRKGLSFFYRKSKLAGYSAIALFVCTIFTNMIAMAAENEYEVTTASGGTVSKTVNIRHLHTGNADSGGGCYGQEVTGYQSEEVNCGGSLYYWPDLNTSQCDRCGASYSGNRSGQSCPHTHEETREYTYYDMNCGKSTGTVTGTFTVSLDTTEWTKEVISTCSYRSTNGLRVLSSPYVINGVATSSAKYKITKNGTYNYSLRTDSNSNSNDSKIVMKVSNIDVTAPQIVATTYEPDGWTKENVVLNVQAADLQPDGKPGVGMANEAYSFDGGITWQSDGRLLCKNNGVYEVTLKDSLDNVATYSVELWKIDREAPNITALSYDETLGVPQLTLAVEANDIMSCGKPGSGIAELGYSFDGGETWVSENTLLVNHNGRVDIAVRDAVGNVAVAEVQITNIDDAAPTITYDISPHKWTNKDAKITVHAKDINTDGSDGIGLPSDCYMYGDTTEWTDKNTIYASKNGTYHVKVRDLKDKVSEADVKVTNIDKIKPQLQLDYELINDGTAARIHAVAKDMQSGIKSDSYEWSIDDAASKDDTRTVTSNGTYSLTVSDLAGNTAHEQISIDDIDSGDDGDDGDDYDIEEKETESETQTESVQEDIDDNDDNSGDDLSDTTGTDGLRKNSNIIKNKVTKAKDKATQTKLLEHQNLMDRLKMLKPWQVVLLVLLLLLLILLVVLLLFLLYRSVLIYNYVSDSKKRLKGVLWVAAKDDRYSIEVSEKIWDRCDTTHVCLSFNCLFALIHKQEEASVHFPEEQVRVIHIAKCADIIIR